jgi:hypothetical protein
MIQTDIQSELNFTSKVLNTDWHYRQQEYLNALSQLGQVAAASDMMVSPKLLQSMELMQQVYPNFLKLNVISTAGNVVASYPMPKPNQAPTSDLGVVKQSIFQATKTTLQPVISDVHIDPVLNIPHADLSVPVFAGDRFVGCIYGSLNLSYIKQFLQSRLFSPEQQVTLIESQNRKIIASTESELLPMQVFDRSRDREIRTLTGLVYFSLPPKDKLPTMVRWQKSLYVQETPLSYNPNWTLVVSVSIAPHITYLQKVYISNLAFMLLTAVLALIGGILLSRSLASPLAGLANVTTNLPNKLLERETII